MCKKEIRDICIYGVGGVGGYFGAKMINMIKEEDIRVSFIARGNYLKEIEKNGLVLKTEGEELNVKPYLVKESINDIEKTDLIMVCVKSYDLDEVINLSNKQGRF